MTPLELSKAALESAQSDLSFQRELLAQFQAKRDEVAGLLEQARKDVQDSKGTPGTNMIDAFGKLHAAQEAFDKLFDEVEHQESAVTGAMEKLEYQQKLHQLVGFDTEAQRQFVDLQVAMYAMVEYLASEAPKALRAWNAMIALRERFLTTVDSILPGVRLHQVPRYWDTEREAEFEKSKDKLLEKLRKFGADLRLVLNPYDRRRSLIDESPDSPVPNIGKFNDPVWRAILILANEPTPLVPGLPDETQDVQVN